MSAGTSSFLWMLDPHQAGVRLVVDSAGLAFSPESCSHAYVNNGSGQVETDTATDPLTGIVRVQTYGYTGGYLTSLSQWVQT